MVDKSKTALGIDENLEGALCYILGFITGIVFLVLEKENKFVRFHAMQSIATFLPLMIIGWIISSLGFLSLSMFWFFGMIATLIWIVELILWIILMLKAYQGEKYKLPIAGDFAEKQIG